MKNIKIINHLRTTNFLMLMILRLCGTRIDVKKRLIVIKFASLKLSPRR